MELVETYTAQIFVGLRVGYSDEIRTIDEVRNICQTYVDEVGLCVTVTPTEFVYTGGGESGAIVGIINYPRFPSTTEGIKTRAQELALRLKEAMGQKRVSIVYPRQTVMIGGE